MSSWTRSALIIKPKKCFALINKNQLAAQNGTHPVARPTPKTSFIKSITQPLRIAGRGWLVASMLIVAVVLAPLVVLFGHAAQGSAEHWQHLLNHVVPISFANTVILLAGVGILVTALGVGSAWLITAYDFPTRRILVWALLLPLAVPTYIVAFAYLDILHPIGPVQSLIRELLGYSSPRQFRLPDIRSLFGAIILLGFVLYPYVYLTTRAMFATQSSNLFEAARILGESRFSAFYRVILPMARPAVAVGVSLALLETLNDIGAAEFLGVQTLTVSIYTTWVTRSDLAGAAQIALAMFILVAALIMIERYGRRRQGYSQNQRSRTIQPLKLRGLRALIAMGLGWFPIVVGFLAPALYLANESWKHLHYSGQVSEQLISSALNTLGIALAATLLTIIAGLIIAWCARTVGYGYKNRFGNGLVRLASIGYAIPGTVLAIGLLSLFVFTDQILSFFHGLFYHDAAPRLFLMGSMTALVLAYMIRFLAISAGGIEAGLGRIPPSIEQASRLLGETPLGTLRRVHLPMLRPALGAAALLIFVDAMKELPATLLLRPMNFETLATWLYAEASRGTYEEGAIAALAIVAAGLLPVIILARTQLRLRK